MSSVSRSCKSLLAVAVGTLLYAGGAIAQVEKVDASMLQDIAHASIAEIETGKLAAGKSKNAEVKKFAKMMVDDHTKGLADVRKVAAAKKVTLPSSPDVMHKGAMVKLKALRGDTFDSQYVEHAGVRDHEATEKLLQKMQTEAKDADVKALAQKMLPVVQAHLGHARELAAAKK